MRNILLVIKNNLYRFTKEKSMIVMVAIVMPIIICLGVYFNNMNDIRGKIAVVGSTVEEQEIIKYSMKDNKKLKIDFMKQSPSKTELIKGIYLAEIDFNKDKPTVTSYGSADIKKSLDATLKGEVYIAKKNNETVQGKVIGFLIMFLFMGATVMVSDFFLSDRENGTYSRVLSGNITYIQYIIGQILYSIIILTVPSTLWSIFILKVLNINLNISYSLLTFLLLLVGILSSSFGMCICTIFKDRRSASMGGSIIVMITSLLGGCLVNFNDTNKIIGFVRNIIPQKRLIDLSNSFNNEDLLYILFVILFFVSISIFIGKRQYENGDFVN